MKRSERGAIGGFETLPFGFLVFFCFTLLAVNTWAVVDTRFTLERAAKEYLRAYSDAPNERRGAEAGRAAVDRTITSPALRNSMSVEEPTGPLRPCTELTVTIRAHIRLINLPFVGGFGDQTVEVTGRDLSDAHRTYEAGSNGLVGTECDA